MSRVESKQDDMLILSIQPSLICASAISEVAGACACMATSRILLSWCSTFWALTPRGLWLSKGVCHNTFYLLHQGCLRSMTPSPSPRAKSTTATTVTHDVGAFLLGMPREFHGSCDIHNNLGLLLQMCPQCKKERTFFTFCWKRSRASHKMSSMLLPISSISKTCWWKKMNLVMSWEMWTHFNYIDHAGWNTQDLGIFSSQRLPTMSQSQFYIYIYIWLPLMPSYEQCRKLLHTCSSSSKFVVEATLAFPVHACSVVSGVIQDGSKTPWRTVRDAMWSAKNDMRREKQLLFLCCFWAFGSRVGCPFWLGPQP